MVIVMVKDLTSGSPLKLIIGFSVPIILGNLVQQLYSWADTLMVGKMIGNSALAAVGATGVITFLIIGFLMGISEGVCLLAARFFGAGDKTGLRRCIGNLIYVCLSITVVLTVVALACNRQILEIMNTPADIIDLSEEYLGVIYVGMIATMLYNVCAGIMRAMGDSKTPLYLLIGSSLANVIFNFVFIPILGVQGAAISTILSQFLAGIVSLIILAKRYDDVKLSKNDLIPRKPILVKLCIMGVPMAFQYSITAVGTIFLQTAINGLGSDTVTAFTVGERVWGFGWSIINCYGVALASFCSQNLGAARLDRIKKGVRSSVVLVSVAAIFFTGIFMLFGQYLSVLFLDAPSEGIIRDIQIYYQVQSPFMLALAMIGIYRNCIMGLGYSMQGMFAGILELIGRTAVSVIFVGAFGFAACCIASPVAWIMADVLLIPMYYYLMRRMQREHPEWAVERAEAV